MASSSPSPRSRNRTVRLGGALLALALFLATVGLFDRLLTARRMPWRSGDAPLTGVWQGTLTVDGAPPATLWLTLQANDNPDSTFNLQGSAELCTPTVTEPFDFFANADRQGQISDLSLRPLGAAPTWLLMDAAAAWQGATLTLSGTVSYAADGQHLFNSAEPPPPFTLTLTRATGGPAGCS